MGVGEKRQGGYPRPLAMRALTSRLTEAARVVSGGRDGVIHPCSLPCNRRRSRGGRSLWATRPPEPQSLLRPGWGAGSQRGSRDGRQMCLFSSRRPSCFLRGPGYPGAIVARAARRLSGLGSERRADEGEPAGVGGDSGGRGPRVCVGWRGGSLPVRRGQRDVKSTAMAGASPLAVDRERMARASRFAGSCCAGCRPRTQGRPWRRAAGAGPAVPGRRRR
jgi:hypothetical protein